MVLKYVYQNACLLLEGEKSCSLNLWFFLIFKFKFFCFAMKCCLVVMSVVFMSLVNGFKICLPKCLLAVGREKSCSLNLWFFLIFTFSFCTCLFLLNLYERLNLTLIFMSVLI